ncbi:phosphatidylglycerophosphatase A family protein [Kordiimonas aquimaris]|uniref:phosphatidylglycerophosphatase A family protein n=1 Tax=Kordiimonas aquimaris TaxID=707591 RepID=UPI0021D2EE8A|nr:phosphatidylglycerophosphatase A [Kordiimonas aquimaris]
MKQSLSSWNTRFSSPAYWIAVGFGSGLLRPAPGTWGSLAALAIAHLFYEIGIGATELFVIIIAATVIGTYAIDHIERETGVHDAPEIVIDEFAGQWLALLPLFYSVASIEKIIAAFVLFRIFDIWKPYPIGWLDRKVSGGFGVMVDDLVAGVYALICLEVITYLFI